MEWINRLNEAMNYIEKHMTDKIDHNVISRIMACSFSAFQRFFVQVADITFSEYIRRRKLSCAAYEIQNSDIKIMDVALKYGYESSDAFSVAFKRMHGIPPTAARKTNAKLKYYAKFNFTYSIKGVNELNYRIVQKQAFKVVGKRRTTPQAGGTWAIVINDGSVEILNKIGRRFDLGMCFGDDEEGNSDYMCALEYEGTLFPGFESYTVPQSTWLVVEANGLISNNVLIDTWRRIYNEFLPHNEYIKTDLPTIEKYIEWNENKNYCVIEIWLPIEKEHEFDHQFVAM